MNIIFIYCKFHKSIGLSVTRNKPIVAKSVVCYSVHVCIMLVMFPICILYFQARYMSLQGETEVLGEKDLKISITTDKYAKTLTIQDSGIGMTKEELIANL